MQVRFAVVQEAGAAALLRVEDLADRATFAII
jgi:hypothetical protein